MIIQYHDEPYLELLNKVLQDGVQKNDRTGTGTRSIFGYQMRFNLNEMSIPLLTTKKMFTKGVIHEILWYLGGQTNIKYLNDNDIHIWDAWADKDGDLGPVYGAQWRRWPKFKHTSLDYMQDPPNCYAVFDEIDQIEDVIRKLKHNPTDRRMIVNAWNVGQLDEMKLPPCHLMFQFWAHNGKLSCQLYQRSADVFLGVPFNIVQYSILTHMIAHVTGMKAAEFVWTGGDVHLYNNHVDQANEQLTREPYPSPTLRLNRYVRDINSFQYDDFQIVNYDSHPSIKAPVSV